MRLKTIAEKIKSNNPGIVVENIGCLSAQWMKYGCFLSPSFFHSNQPSANTIARPCCQRGLNILLVATVSTRALISGGLSHHPGAYPQKTGSRCSCSSRSLSSRTLLRGIVCRCNSPILPQFHPVQISGIKKPATKGWFLRGILVGTRGFEPPTPHDGARLS